MRFNSENNDKNFLDSDLKCYNQYCKIILGTKINCISCTKIFCEKCLINCEVCGNKVCKFCCKVNYLKFNDIYVCHLCFDKR